MRTREGTERGKGTELGRGRTRADRRDARSGRWPRAGRAQQTGHGAWDMGRGEGGRTQRGQGAQGGGGCGTGLCTGGTERCVQVPAPKRRRRTQTRDRRAAAAKRYAESSQLSGGPFHICPGSVQGKGRAVAGERSRSSVGTDRRAMPRYNLSPSAAAALPTRPKRARRSAEDQTSECCLAQHRLHV